MKICSTLSWFCLLGALFAGALLGQGCGGSAQTPPAQGQTPPAEVTQPPEAPPAPAVDAAVMAAGQTLYQANCLACHQADGRGVPGLNPPLAKSDWVAGDLARLVGVLLNGQQGPITVNGERYNGVMPKQAHLTNEELAQLLTYVRNSFGNQLGPVNLEQVQALRK